MIRQPPRSTLDRSSAASDVYKRQFYIGNKPIQLQALDDPNIDIVSSHHYPDSNRGVDQMIADIGKFHEQISGKKVYIVGEFGFIPPPDIRKLLDAVIGKGL